MKTVTFSQFKTESLKGEYDNFNSIFNSAYRKTPTAMRNKKIGKMCLLVPLCTLSIVAIAGVVAQASTINPVDILKSEHTDLWLKFKQSVLEVGQFSDSMLEGRALWDCGYLPAFSSNEAEILKTSFTGMSDYDILQEIIKDILDGFKLCH